MTVFVPVAVAAALTLRSSGSAGDLIGYADGPALRRWLGEPGLDREEADYVALNHAGIAALLSDDSAPARLVLAVDLPIIGADDLGRVQLSEVSWADVRSLFADEISAADLVARARTAVRGRTLEAALHDPVVAELLDGHDLLWYAPEELDALI